jgi:hypothetical protein
MVLPEEDVEDDAWELESLEEVEAEDAVDVDEVAPSEVPGIVAALTAVKMPRPATAASPAPTVRRLRRRSAASRASVELAVSMSYSLDPVYQPYMGTGWDLSGTLRLVPPEGIEPPTLTLGPSCSIP